MKLVLMFLAGVSVVEALLFLRWSWWVRKPLALLVTAGLALGTGMLLASAPGPLTVLFAVATLYRIENVYRFVASRINKQHLLKSGRHSYVWLVSLQLLILGAYGLSTHFTVTGLAVAYGLCAATCIVAFGLAVTLLRSVRRMRMKRIEHGFSHRELPTVTVAIPARNETDDLEACLQSLVASDYPKLEIIVLDDCSQIPRTPEIIRQFAHDGVRFIAGEAPPGSWLAKNYAYYQLAKEANGEYLLFCGVDTRFEPQAVTKLVESLLVEEAVMASYMPVNILSTGREEALLIQPMRYAWEIAVPRRWANRPPLLSTCWLARRDFLEDQGGFAAVSNTILPERYFARAAQNRNAYRFYLAPGWLGLNTVKSGGEELDTALRMRYPQVHRRPEFVFLLSCLELVLSAVPGLGLLYGLIFPHLFLRVINLLSILVIGYMYAFLVRLAYRRRSPASFFRAPFALVYDLVLLNISMARYEFSEVYWKGRNICIPVLQAVPKSDFIAGLARKS